MAQQRRNLSKSAGDFLRMLQGLETPLGLREVRDLYISHIISTYGRRQAPGILGIGRTTLYRFLGDGTLGKYRRRKR